MRHRLYYHIVWTTRQREATINADVARFLVRCLRAIVRQERGRLLEIGIVATHVHLLLTLHPLSSIPRLLQRLKGGSGMLINRGLMAGIQFRWSDGYNVETVSPSDLPRIRDYVRSQPLHHPGDAIAGWSGVESAPETLRSTS